MTLSSAETRVIAEFAPFVGGSPRRAKRYLNLYLLIKTGIGFADAQMVSQRALMALLAIVTGLGRPNNFFGVLEGLESQNQTLQGLVDALQRSEPSDGPLKSAEVIRKLIEINQRDRVDYGAEMISALRDLAPTARRYSF